MNKKLIISNREEWRSWLKKNHTTVDEIWLVYYKKNSDIESIDYIESVEEALCFGWIDGLKKRIDEQKYARRFSPRKTKSKWSPKNIEIAKRMIKEGTMTDAGLTSYNQKIEYDKKFIELKESQELILTPEIEKILKKNKKVWENFNNLAPGYKKQYLLWLVSAKKQETRVRRLQEAIELLKENKKLGMK